MSQACFVLFVLKNYCWLCCYFVDRLANQTTSGRRLCFAQDDRFCIILQVIFILKCHIAASLPLDRSQSAFVAPELAARHRKPKAIPVVRSNRRGALQAYRLKRLESRNGHQGRANGALFPSQSERAWRHPLWLEVSQIISAISSRRLPKIDRSVG